jgi:phage tail protein X
MVRVPLDHYEHYVRQAEALQIPIGDFIAYRMAVYEGLKIPSAVLAANPGLLALLPEPQRRQALAENPGLGARYQALAGTDPLPFDDVTDHQEADRPAA